MKIFLKIFLCLINVCAAIVLFCCFITRFFNPSSFPYCELIALGFPIFFILNGMLMICWLFSKNHKKFILISLVPLLLCLPTLGCYYVFKKDPKPETTSKNKLKIMSYNVMGFTYMTWRKSTEVKQQMFLQIRKNNPDVICFQEYHNDTQEDFLMLDSLKQQLNLSYVHHNKLFSVGPHHFQGNLICSRYPIVNSGTMDYEKTGNSSIWADIAVGDDTIRIFDSHLESYRLSKENRQTVNELGKVKLDAMDEVDNLLSKLTKSIEKRGIQIDELAEAIAQSPYPVISCGDFNSPACSYAYNHIKKSRKLNDAFIEAGSGVGATFNWWPQLRLDYILYDKQFTGKNYKRTGLKVSDHFPISCEIDLYSKQ